jgi:uncharacterized Rmd1/YagE family protein
VYTPYSLSYPPGPPKKSNGSDHPEPSVTFLPEMFLFDYGVVVFWGMTLTEEQRILKELKPFEDETLGNPLSTKRWLSFTLDSSLYRIR